MSTVEPTPQTRRIRPWIAALLTFLGWGVGFYYARRTGAAVWAAVLSVVVSVAVGLAAITYWLATRTAPLTLFNPDGWSLLDTINLVLTVLVAIGVWRLAAKEQQVERAGAARLFGYLSIWLLPILIALMLAMTLRFTTMQPFRARSLSMAPTIERGDYFVVSKWRYGYSRYSVAPLESLFPAGRLFPRLPELGDVVVFRPAPDPSRDFVARIVGLPGDRVQMLGGVLHINGNAVPRERAAPVAIAGEVDPNPAYRETLPNGVRYVILDTGETELDDTRVFAVPPEHYFVLGDHRDNSADSRVPSVMGYVPFDNLVGKVVYIMRPNGSQRTAE